MTLNQMKYVTVLAQCLNYSEAAKILYISQPALSRQIALVEEEIGTKLFIRNNKYTALTPAGHRMYNGLKDILNEYDELIDDVQRLGNAGTSALRIGLIEMRAVLPSVQIAIKQITESGSKVDILSRGAEELRNGIMNDQYDLVITYDNVLTSLPAEYEHITLDLINNCLVIPSSHPKANLKNPVLADFKDEVFLSLDEKNKKYEENFQQSCSIAGFKPKLKYVDTFSDLVASTVSEVALACFPEDHYLSHMPNLKFVKIPEIESSGIYAIWRKSSSNKLLENFIEIIKKNI